MTQVIGTVFKKRGVEGDFDWQIRSGNYEDALFIYNDDEKRRLWKKAGTGNAVIRKYNRYACPNRPRSAGVCTGKGENGYDTLDESTKAVIDQGIAEIRQLIQDHGYRRVYYSAATPNGLLGTSIFVVHPDVLSYITNELQQLQSE
jgi:hypothetical protein